MKSYIILFQCNDAIVRTKSKEFHISSGYYAYVGSCGLNCAKRVSRHLVKEKEKKHWHVDYLSEQCEPILALILPIEEKELAKILSVYGYVRGFGSTDDKINPSHLFKVSINSLFNLIRVTKE